MNSSVIARRLWKTVISSFMLALAVLIVCNPLNSYAIEEAPSTNGRSLIAADGGDDEAAPAASSVAVLNAGAAVHKPGTLKVRVGLVEDGTGIKTIQMRLSADSGKTYFDHYFEYTPGLSGTQGGTTYLDGPLYTGDADLCVPIPADAHTGAWHVTGIYMWDQAGNHGWIDVADGSWRYRDADTADTGIAAPAFTITGAQGDEAAPAASSVAVLNAGAAVHKPGTLKVRVGLVEDGTGIKTIQMRLSADSGKTYFDHYFEYTPGLSGTQGGTTYLDGPLYTGDADLCVPIPADAHTGAWHVTGIYMWDQAGNHGWIDVADGSWRYRDADTADTGIAAPAFTITGAQGDEAAPAASSVAVLNAGAAVHKPGTLKVRVGLVEDGTGIKTIQMRLSADSGKTYFDHYFEYTPGLSGTQGGTTYLDGPLYTGDADLCVPIPADAHTGAWHVTGIYMWDQAGNHGWIDVADGSWRYRDADTADTGIAAPAFTIKDEFTYAFTTSLTNPKLINKLASLGEGKAARIKIDGNGILPKAAFDAIKGHNRTIVAYGESIQWIFNGKNIKNETKDVNLKVSISMVSGNTLSSGEKAVSCTFANNGLLPGKAQVRFKSDYLYSFSGVEGSLRLYYVEGNNYTLERGNFDLVFDGTDKWCYMDVTHNSKFLVSGYPLQGLKMSQAKVSGVNKSYVYNGTRRTPMVKVRLGGVSLKNGADFKVTLKNNENAGIATAKIAGKGDYKNAGSVTVAFKIKQAANKAMVKKTKVKKSIKAISLKKKAARLVLPKVKTKFGVPKWKIVAKDKKKALSLKGNAVNVKKGVKKGTYSMKLIAVVAKTKNYKAATTKTVTVSVIVR